MGGDHGGVGGRARKERASDRDREREIEKERKELHLHSIAREMRVVGRVSLAKQNRHTELSPFPSF